MVRLVFRPYTQIRRTICTSVSLRASTRVSSGFTLLRHSSPSFGSQQVRSYSNLSKNIQIGRWCGSRLTTTTSHLGEPSPPSLSFRMRVSLCPNTRVHDRLLGPCFKTGRLRPFRQHLEHACGATPEDKPATKTLNQSPHSEPAANAGTQPEARAFFLGRTGGIGSS